jgi:hypothetical protein
LFRAGFAVLETGFAKWVELVEQRRVSVQSELKPKNGRPESGQANAARELGLDRLDVHRAVKVASIAAEAKDAARAAGLVVTASGTRVFIGIVNSTVDTIAERLD